MLLYTILPRVSIPRGAAGLLWERLATGRAPGPTGQGEETFLQDTACLIAARAGPLPLDTPGRTG